MGLTTTPCRSTWPHEFSRMPSHHCRGGPARRTVMVVVEGITIYLVFPSLTELFDSWPKLTSLDPGWVRAHPGLTGCAFRLYHRAPADCVTDHGLVLGGHGTAGGECHQPCGTRWRRIRRGHPVPDARRLGEQHGHRRRGPDRLLTAGHRRTGSRSPIFVLLAILVGARIDQRREAVRGCLVHASDSCGVVTVAVRAYIARQALGWSDGNARRQSPCMRGPGNRSPPTGRRSGTKTPSSESSSIGVCTRFRAGRRASPTFRSCSSRVVPSGCCGRTRTPSGTSTPCRSREARRRRTTHRSTATTTPTTTSSRRSTTPPWVRTWTTSPTSATWRERGTSC